MADFIITTEGKNELLTNGLPATCRFLLSTATIGTGIVAGTTLGGGVTEITGTGYARTSQAKPTPSAGTATFTQMSWANGAATDWPATTRTVVLVTTADNTGKTICAWHLQAAGVARDMSAANTTEQFTPTLTLS